MRQDKEGLRNESQRHVCVMSAVFNAMVRQPRGWWFVSIRIEVATLRLGLGGTRLNGKVVPPTLFTSRESLVCAEHRLPCRVPVIPFGSRNVSRCEKFLVRLTEDPIAGTADKTRPRQDAARGSSEMAYRMASW